MCFDRWIDLFFHLESSSFRLLIAESCKETVSCDIVARLSSLGCKCQDFCPNISGFVPPQISIRFASRYVFVRSHAIRRAISIETAKEILLKAVSKFPKEGVLYFNLACYDCQLGQLDSARNFLNEAFQIDPAWRIQALQDEDLEPLRSLNMSGC